MLNHSTLPVGRGASWLPSLGSQGVVDTTEGTEQKHNGIYEEENNNSVRRGAVWKGVRKRLCTYTDLVSAQPYPFPATALSGQA